MVIKKELREKLESFRNKDGKYMYRKAERFLERNPEFKESLMRNTISLENSLMGENMEILTVVRIHNFINGITHMPRCKYCNSVLKYRYSKRDGSYFFHETLRNVYRNIEDMNCSRSVCSILKRKEIYSSKDKDTKKRITEKTKDTIKKDNIRKYGITTDEGLVNYMENLMSGFKKKGFKNLGNIYMRIHIITKDDHYLYRRLRKYLKGYIVNITENYEMLNKDLIFLYYNKESFEKVECSICSKNLNFKQIKTLYYDRKRTYSTEKIYCSKSCVMVNTNKNYGNYMQKMAKLKEKENFGFVEIKKL